jgi:hypothetical protein
MPFSACIDWKDKTNRRNLPIFLDMVRGFTILNSSQRNTDDVGRPIATPDDFKAAARLYNSRGGFQRYHINDVEKKFLQAIIQNDGELDTQEAMKALKLGRTRVLALANRLQLVPGFEIEKRSHNTEDSDSKHTTTHRNYYCYSGPLATTGGTIQLAAFESVVTLRDCGDCSETDHCHHCHTTVTPLSPPQSDSGPTKNGDRGEEKREREKRERDREREKRENRPLSPKM